MLRLGLQRCLLNAPTSGFVGALDNYTTGLTWAGSVKRRLLASYSGALLRTRSTAGGSPESDIGYDATGVRDAAALASFVGSNSTYLTTMYAQAGSLGNLVQATSSSQPRLVNAGANEDSDGAYFDGSDDKMGVLSIALLSLLSASSGQIWLRAKTNNPANNGRLVAITGDETGFWDYFAGSSYFDYGSTATGRISGAVPSGIVGSWYDISLEKDGGTSRIRVNGTVAISGSTSATLSAATVDLCIGNLVAGGGAWKGWLKELAIWNDGTAANCVARCAALAA